MEGRQILTRSLAAGAVFNTSYLMYAVLVPLDAVHLGFPLWEVGVLTATAGFLQLPTLIVSGPLSDVWGEPVLIRATFICTLSAGLFALLVHPALLGLVLGQLGIGLARGVFWAPAQSLVSRQPVDRTHAMGLFTTYTKGGALVGIFSAGLAASVLGIAPAFAITVMLAVIGLAITWPIPTRLATQGTIKMRTALAGMWPAAQRPFVLLYGSVAFLCAMPQALAQSFYPVYLLHLQAGRTLVGAITALMSLGMTLSGLTCATTMRRLGLRRTVVFGSLMMVAGFAITPIHSIVVSAVGIFAAGWAAGWLNVSFLTRVSASSRHQERGTNLAMTQSFFAISMSVTPLLSGWASAALGFWAGFGFPALLVTLLTGLYILLVRKNDGQEVVDQAV